MKFTASSRRGIAHQYTSRLVAFEHTPTADTSAQNLLIFIGGLLDGLLTVSYPSRIADALTENWSLAQILLSSSYTGWGTGSLQVDAKEISRCISYFRTIKTGKIVLIGHSTGCQDIMEYLTGPGHEKWGPIDGCIIQAPASDREAMTKALGPEIYKDICTLAQDMAISGKGEDILPLEKTELLLPGPVCARRWLSLASPNHDGDDDYFSSDLTDAQLMKSFGKLPARSPLCILVSGNDEYMPETIDKEALVKKWIGFVQKGTGKVDEDYSGVLDGASHNLQRDPEEVVLGLVKRVLGFLNKLPQQSNL